MKKEKKKSLLFSKSIKKNFLHGFKFPKAYRRNRDDNKGRKKYYIIIR